MMRSLYSGISGLKSHQTAMDVVGNNISNVNTTGFKSSRVTFADTLNQTLSSASAPAGNIGGINAKQIGLGSGVAAIDTIFTDGSVKSTGLNTDMCLSGNGLFVVHSESSANEMYYTRNGNFKFDAAGNFVTSDGYKVQGWVADASGKITVDPSKTSDITIPAGKVMEATKTEKAVYNSNLNSGEATIAGITMMDDNGSKIVVSQNNVDTISCGRKYNDTAQAKINNINLEFKEGCTITAAKGQYGITKEYQLVSALNVSCGSGDTILVPKGSNNAYNKGGEVAALSVKEIVAGSQVAVLDDDAIFSNNSNSAYKVILANGDTIDVPAPPTAAFTKGSAVTGLSVQSVAGNTVTLTDGTNTYTLTNNSGSSYASPNPLNQSVADIKIVSTDTISNVDAALDIACSNGCSLIVPKNASGDYDIGNKIGEPISSFPVKEVKANSKYVTLENGAVFTNNDAASTYSVTLSNGDVLEVAAPPAFDFAKGGAVPALTVAGVVGTTVTLNDGTNNYTLTNNSGTNYGGTVTTLTGNIASIAINSTTELSGMNGAVEISCSNGDTISVPDTSTNSYKLGSEISLLSVNEIKKNSKEVTLSDDAVLTNNSGSGYIVTLADGNVLTVTAPPGQTFTKGAAMPTLTVSGINGKEITLTDGTNTYTLTNNVGKTYNLGDSVNENVISISIDSAATLSNAKGMVLSSNGVKDEFAMNSGTIKAANGITVSSMELTDNLDSVITISNANNREYKVGEKYEGSIDSMALTMSDGTSTSEVSGSYTMGYSKPLSTLITVYDTLGNEHNITIFLTKTGVDSLKGNEWTASINLDGSGVTTIKEADGTVSTVSMPDLKIRFSPNGDCTTGVGTAELTLRNGSQADQKVNVDFSGVTQFAGSNTAYGTTDGNAYGTLKSISINTAGTIIGTYTNGINRAEAQVAIAQFNNASGLTKIGNSMYTASNNSGTANINTASALGCNITPSSLEMSNVDMATELTDMIVTQRGYQSNSKIITVSDELLETLINMKR